MDKKTKMKFNILAIICIIVFAFALAPKTLQNDTFYTISIGEHIMENGIDKVDPFSWSDLKYTYPHWLYDVGIYLIYNVSGMTGIYISTIILSMILGVMLYITNLKINKNNLFSFILTMGVMFMMKDFLAARAQLVTFILFVTEILFIECFLETKKKRYVVRTYGYSSHDSKCSCCSILCVLCVNDAIFCRIYNNSFTRSTFII